jgi:hypothetical protein
MDVSVTIAGVISLVLGAGHETIGSVWVLPRLTDEHLAKTPFGPPSMTEAMVRVTWHVVTLFALASGGLLLMLAATPMSDARTLALRWFAGMWIAATAMAFYVTRTRPSRLLRLPVPLLWVVVAVLCWVAST